jgi:hypothetical protein
VDLVVDVSVDWEPAVLVELEERPLGRPELHHLKGRLGNPRLVALVVDESVDWVSAAAADSAPHPLGYPVDHRSAA